VLYGLLLLLPWQAGRQWWLGHAITHAADLLPGRLILRLLLW
jgi:hypothetical protein